MKAVLRSALRLADRAVCEASLALGDERPALISFLFHSLFSDRREAGAGLVDPFQPVTVADFETFIGDFREAGYRFVTPDGIAAGLAPGGRYVCITFDDGYANNLRALPILRRFDVPATIFVSTNHVRRGRCYWWDVQYRARRRAGWSPAAIDAERVALKALTYAEIESRLGEELGARSFEPEGETDRPLNEAELKRLAAEPRITIGNHTSDHAILTAHDEDQIQAQIEDCQAYLTDLLGSPPRVIAYPNGNYDDRTLRIAAEAGFAVGFTVEPRKSRLPLAAQDLLRLPRYALDGGPDTRQQCRSCRSALQLRHTVRRLRAA